MPFFLPFLFSPSPFQIVYLFWLHEMNRWPNFSVDFPKLISCCIPNENCVKIGKLLIRSNGKKKYFFPPFLSTSLSIYLAHLIPSLSNTHICYGWIFIDGGLLMQVQTNCHHCLCSMLAHLLRQESQAQTWATAQAWGPNTSCGHIITHRDKA